jgi:hypothetical protein
MAKLIINQFAGMAPRFDPKELASQQSSLARDVDLLSKKARAITDTAVTEVIESGQQSIFLWEDPSPSKWLSWTTDVDVVRTMLGGDIYSRIYFTGDGNPKVRGIDATVDEEYDLGLPAPALTPTTTTQQKSLTNWTRTWHYWYEEPSGNTVDAGTLTEGVDVTVDAGERVYTIASIPAKVTASADAVFVAYYDGTSDGGVHLGRVWPSISKYQASSDFVLNGAIGILVQLTTSGSSELTLVLDEPDPSSFSVERTYAETFVTEWGEEGPPSVPSVVQKVTPAQDAVVSNMTTTITGNYNVTKKRLYRSIVSRTTGTSFFLVAEIDLSVATYTDSKLDSEINDAANELKSDGNGRVGRSWQPPPSGLTGLIQMPGGILAGFVGREVYLSEPYQPHAWPVGYSKGVDYDIVGLAVTGNTLVVMTKGFPYAMNIIDPATSQFTRIELNQPCVAKRGIVDGGSFVVYPSKNGLVFIQGSTARLATEGYYTRKEWAATNPETMIAGIHNRNLYMFTSSSGLIFDLDEREIGFIETSLAATGIHTDLETDTLYLIVGTNIVEWEGGSTKLPGYWRSFEMSFEREFTPVVLRVVSDTYPVTVELWAEGAIVSTLSVSDDEARKVPTLRPEKNWMVSTTVAGDVDQILIASSMSELRK